MLGSFRCLLFSLLVTAVFPVSVSAEERIAEQDGLGIELEELPSDRGTFRLELGTTLSATRQDGVVGLFPTIQTGTGEFVSVPVDVGSTNRRAETVLATAGLRYGLSSSSELYARATFRHDNSVFTNDLTGQVQSLSEGSLQGLTLGVNYRFLDEGEHPGLIGFADAALLENTAARGSDYQSGKSGTIGITAYRVLDPVVLSLTTGFRANLERDTGPAVARLAAGPLWRSVSCT